MNFEDISKKDSISPSDFDKKLIFEDFLIINQEKNSFDNKTDRNILLKQDLILLTTSKTKQVLKLTSKVKENKKIKKLSDKKFSLL